MALFPNENRENTIYRSKAVGEPPLMLAISVFAAIADAIHSLGARQAGAAGCARDAGIHLACGARCDAGLRHRNTTMTVWPTIRAVRDRVRRRCARHGRRCAGGSSPRDAGVRMMVRPDGGFSGTIGGGTLEWIALAEAQALMSGSGKPDFKRIESAGAGPWPVLRRLGRDHAGAASARTTCLIAMLAEAEQSRPAGDGRRAKTTGRPVREIAAPDVARLPTSHPMRVCPMAA